jgi:hypothetical protein
MKLEMKCKWLAVMFALAAVAWAQTATPMPQQSTTPAAKAKCACCAKMASSDAKDGQSCARHMSQKADGKQAPSCCCGKNEKSCCGKNAAAQCMKDGKTSCCSDNNQDKVASSCCGSDSGDCCSRKNAKASRSCCRKSLQS